MRPSRERRRDAFLLRGIQTRRRRHQPGRATTPRRNVPLLYARVDLVEPTPDTPAVIELELIEPELFFPNVPEAAARFADALLARLA